MKPRPGVLQHFSCVQHLFGLCAQILCYVLGEAVHEVVVSLAKLVVSLTQLVKCCHAKHQHEMHDAQVSVVSRQFDHLGHQ